MTDFAYNMGIPNPPNQPSQDVPLMQTNTNSISGIIAVDHIGFEANNGGYHTVIHQITQNSDPVAIPNISQVYSKVANGDNQLFFESGTGKISQLTGSNTLIQGYQWIGGVLMQWGQGTITGTHSTGTITYSSSSGIAMPNATFVVLLSLKANSTGVGSSDNTLSYVSFTNTGFTWLYNGNGSGSYPSFNWIAIGN